MADCKARDEDPDKESHLFVLYARISDTDDAVLHHDVG